MPQLKVDPDIFDSLFAGLGAVDVDSTGLRKSADEKESNYTYNRQVYFQGTNVFSGNHADVQGGAIAYRGIDFIDSGTMLFRNNTAGVYSDTVSSYATRIKIINDSRNTELVPLTKAEDQRIGKASGQEHEHTSSATSHTAGPVDLSDREIMIQNGLQPIEGAAGTPASA